MMPPPVRRLRRPLPAAALALALTLGLAACAVTRVEPSPPFAVPPRFAEAGDWQPATAAGAAVPEAWWTLFHDPVLDDLEARLALGNENLKAAVAQVASARALLAASRGAGQPNLSAGLAATRSRSPSASTSASAQNPADSVALTASASWELDLWGRLAQATAGAEAGYQASVDDLAAARLSAQATLAQTYLALRLAEAQQALLARSLAAYQRSLTLTQDRYQGGVASRSDVLQAESQLRSVQAQAAEAGIQRAQLAHAIAVLLGQPPSALALAATGVLPANLEAPTSLPAALLQRRPDIAAAERRVAAAYAQIGVADAAWFPSLTLSASAGVRQSALAHLVSAPNLFWSIGPSLVETVLDGGQRRLASAQARAAADAATAGYRQTVLVALQEVEDNLVLANELQHEADFEAEALAAAARNLEITLAQYQAGTVGYLNVVTAQAAALGAESSLLALRGRQLAAVNQLLKNIAGTWAPG